MIGRPKYKLGDTVRFILSDRKEREEFIMVVDNYGTFGDASDVSYDVMVEAENMLYKHISEKYIKVEA